MKKLLTVLLTALMVVTLGVVNIAAEGEETETVAAEVLENAGTEETLLEAVSRPEPKVEVVVTEPEAKVLEYTGKEEELIVPGSVAVKPVENKPDPSKDYFFRYEVLVNEDDTPSWDRKKVDNPVPPVTNVPKRKNIGTYYVAWQLFKGREKVDGKGGVVESKITKIALTVIPTDNGKIYGEEDPELIDFTVTGKLLKGHKVYAELAREEGEDVGIYDIKVEFANVQKNDEPHPHKLDKVEAPNPPTPEDIGQYYELSYETGTFTISKAEIEIVTEPFTEAIINADTDEAEFIVKNYEELEDALGEVKFVDTDGEEIPYEVITLYPGTAQSRRVASIKLNVENGIKQVILLDNKNYKGAKGLIVRPGVLMVTATDLKFKKGSKKDRTININVEVKEAPEENYFGEPYVTVDGKQIALDTDFVFTEEGNVKLLGTYLKTLDHGDHKFVLHNAYEFPGVCVESNIHVSHNTNNDDTVRIVSTGIE